MTFEDGLTSESRLAKSRARYMVGMAGRLPKWPTGADCKSAGLRLRWFESITYHHLKNKGEIAILSSICSGYVNVYLFDSVRFHALPVSCRLFRNEA